MTKFNERLSSLRHVFHQNPGLGFEEEWTKSCIAEHLRDLGRETHERHARITGSSSALG